MKLFKLFTIGCLLVFFTACSSDDSEDVVAVDQIEDVDESIDTLEDTTIEIEIMALINAYRISKGLTALSNNDLVKEQAFNHTIYMIANADISHDNFDVRRDYLQNNAGASSVGENVAYSYNTAESVVNGWLNSDGHRENIEGNFTHFGISAEQNTEGTWYYTNIFIRK